MASASEQRTSFDGMPLLMRLTMSVSAKTPHLAATWCSLLSSKWRLVTSSGGAFDLEEALVDGGAGAARRTCRSSTAMAVLSPVFSSFLNMMIFASCPPSSMTLADVGVQVLDRERDGVDLLDELAARGRAERARRPSR